MALNICEANFTSLATERLSRARTNAFRNIITAAKQAVYRRNGLTKTFGAHVIIDFRVAVSRESREERALGLSPLLFFFGYFLKIQKVTKIPNTN